MKWENCDINVLGRANLQKFSKLGDIVTPLRLLELLFEDVLVDMIAGYASFTVIERKQTLVLKLLMKKFAYS